MTTDTKLNELIINTLSPEQFEPITPSDTELYLVEDDVEYATVDELASKQDILIAGNGVDITDNKISTNTQFVITEDMFDLEYDATKGVAPYNASYGYTNITIHTNAGVEWIEGAMYSFVLDTKVATSANRNVRVRIGEEGDWKPIMVASSIAVGSTVFVKAINNIFFYKSTYQENGALHCFYDTNTTYTINYSIDAGQKKAGIGAYAVSRYSLIMQKPDMTWEKITDTTKIYTTATSKTVNKRGFLLNQIRYYNYTTNYANGALMSATYIYEKSASVNGSYSFNCGTAPNWEIGDYIYLVGTVGSDGLFYLDETKWWDNALPIEKDGKLYIQLGIALTATDSTMSFYANRPIYYHDGTSIREYLQADNKQDVIEDLDTIRSGASAGATALQEIPEEYVKNTDYATDSTAGVIKVSTTYGLSRTTSGALYGATINKANYNSGNNGLLIGKGTLENIKESLVTSVGDTKYQPIIEDLDEIRTNAETGAGLSTQVESNTQRIEELATSKLPNATPVGTPHIVGSYVSNFSDTSYMLFPFTDISRGYPFDIYFSFTTSDDITTQQNILDSYFGIALAIQNNKGIMALSSNGINWDIGTSIGTNTLLPNTTYYVKYSWTGEQYNASISTNKESYVPDMILNSTLSPHKTTIYIGGSPNLFGAGSAHPFKGTINFKDAKVVVQGIDVWDGYADVGFQTRANVSLSNLDEAGEYRFSTKQDVTDYGLATSDKTIVGAINEINSKASVPDLDETTINLNDTNKLQAIGVIDKNKGDVKYDWIGTQSEWKEQNIAEEHPEWLCYITDDSFDDNTILLNNPYSLLDSKYSEYELKNLSWLKSEGQWNDGNTYTSTYELLLKLLNGTETIEGILVKAVGDSSITDYDFVVDMVNVQFRLPLLDGSESMVTDQPTFSTLGLPQYPLNSGADWVAPFSGVVFLRATRYPDNGNTLNIYRNTHLIVSAPAWNISFFNYSFPVTKGDVIKVATDGTSNNWQITLQQFYRYKGNGTLYFYVGETTQNANLIDAGRIAEQLTNKVDINSSWGFPSSRYIDLTLGASGSEYTAPANGYVVLIGTTTSAGTCRLRNLSSGYALSNGDASQSFYINLSIPVKKNDNFNWERQGGAFNINVAIFRFIYAEGAE